MVNNQVIKLNEASTEILFQFINEFVSYNPYTIVSYLITKVINWSYYSEVLKYYREIYLYFLIKQETILY